MKRKIIDVLIKWNHTLFDKPLLLTGTKGVGKTYLAYDFAKAFFKQILYINLEREPAVDNLFSAPNVYEVNQLLINHFNISEEDQPENRLLILDEISFCPASFQWLASLQTLGTFPRIITITSNPIPYKEQSLFHTVSVYPLQFDEFLRATSNEWYIEAIQTHFNNSKKIPEIVHNELLTLHDLYMQIGGMPGVINEYLNFLSTVNVSEQQRFLMSSYHDMIYKSNTESDALKMNQILNSLALQLMKENKKFQYRLIRKGTTHAMYRDAIRYLTDRDYTLQCRKVSAEQLNSPIQSLLNNEAFTDDAESNFKLYFPDVGFLYSSLAKESVLPLEASIRKALLENYIAQALHAGGYPLMFWESESMAKIDFIIPKESDLIPVEIHNDDNTRSKSISVLKQKCNFPYAVKISSKNFEYSNQIKYVPYYAVFCL